VEFEPNQVSYQDLLNRFWQIVNPTQKDGQGQDIGSQYRSAIYFHSDEQHAEAEASKRQEQKNNEETIITEITPAQTFYKAEDYHQKYLQKNPGGYCHVDFSKLNP
jgi:peptide-methionine (S)-S-oxide reductase